MVSRSTKRLMGIESEQAGNWFKVCTERSIPTPGSLDNMGSLLVKIRVER